MTGIIGGCVKIQVGRETGEYGGFEEKLEKMQKEEEEKKKTRMTNK